MSKWFLLVLFGLCLLNVNGTHVFKLEQDFSKIKSDEALAKNMEEVLKKLRMFKVPVHPRIPLLYRLLKKGMYLYSHRTADSLYVPYVYMNKESTEA